MSEHHIVMPKTYATVLGCLFVLMAATIGASYIHLGSTYNLLLALFIALCKMSLIVMFFMHVKYSSKLTKVFAASGFFWLIIFFTLLFADYMARHLSTSPFAGSPYGG
ncbi:MAG: cytochrome C oxidase subunit IV family protein [Candidatus Hydrogenedentes bacterium]|nr:cytochrome C oxidase subunit IV family protein [Candidatus Hydrogenedentota bacterium]